MERELASRNGYGKEPFCIAKYSSAPAYPIAYGIITSGAMVICLVENLESKNRKSVRRESKGARCIVRSVRKGNFMRPSTGKDGVGEDILAGRMSEGANMRRDQ